MKIGLDKAPDSPAGSYSQHLAKVLERYAPEHEYVVDGKHYDEIDVYHGFRPGLPWQLRMKRVPHVVTVRDLNFLRYPGMYTLAERLFLLRAYRKAYRAADRLIALNRGAREELAEKLDIDARKIEVLMPLAALAPQHSPNEAECESVRRKYMLPAEYVLMLGTVEPRHNHEALLDALSETDSDAGAVVCGRRTAYSDFLLGYARERHLAARLNFIYELKPEDLPALFRMARVFVYLPDAELEAPIVPVVEALRAEVPMVLSDTPLNREAAGDAALYVHPEIDGELSAALKNALRDETFRSDMADRERRRAELFSEYAVAQRLIDIYSSL